MRVVRGGRGISLEKTGADPKIEDGAERRTRGGEMLPTLTVGWRASATRGEEAGRFREVGGVPAFAVDTLTVYRQPNDLKLNKLLTGRSRH